MKNKIYLLFLSILPAHILSRSFGAFARLHLPMFLRGLVLSSYAKMFQVDVSEAERNLLEYESLGAFFTRALRKGKRKIDGGPNSIVSPVDGRILHWGKIENGQIFQAKGIHYALSDLLAGDYLEKFEGGTFMTIYLSPQDYHRIHTPMECTLISSSYIPGKLFTVNPMALTEIKGLFARNERLVSYLKNPKGICALIKVGAINVGRIRVTYDDIITNQWSRQPIKRQYKGIKFKKAQEIGRFEMGSTVVLLFEKGKVDWIKTLVPHQKIHLGEKIGVWRASRK